MPENQKRPEIPVGEYTFSQELRDMLRAAYRWNTCECHYKRIEQIISGLSSRHAHFRFVEMVAKADEAVRGEGEG